MNLENSIFLRNWEICAPILAIFVATVYFLKNSQTKSDERKVKTTGTGGKKLKLSEEEYIGGE
jgi:hypothetical protein